MQTAIEVSSGSVNPVTAIIRFYGAAPASHCRTQYGAINFSFIPA
jgi:hypothetical protein